VTETRVGFSCDSTIQKLKEGMLKERNSKGFGVCEEGEKRKVGKRREEGSLKYSSLG